MNRAIITGNLTKDPEHSATPNGVSLTKFTIAVSRRFSQGEQKADFLNIVTWAGLADNCAKYLHKGSKVGVVGQIQTRQYDDKKGVRRYVTEITADEVEFLSPKMQDGDSPDRGRVEYSAQHSADDLFADELAAFEPVDAEIPF